MYQRLMFLAESVTIVSRRFRKDRVLSLSVSILCTYIAGSKMDINVLNMGKIVRLVFRATLNGRNF